jgi:hypothetical protein
MGGDGECFCHSWVGIARRTGKLFNEACPLQIAGWLPT